MIETLYQHGTLSTTTAMGLSLLVGPDQTWLTTMAFLDRIDENLNAALAG